MSDETVSSGTFPFFGKKLGTIKIFRLIFSYNKFHNLHKGVHFLFEVGIPLFLFFLFDYKEVHIFNPFQKHIEFLVEGVSC